jgi:hypothetical protein
MARFPPHRFQNDSWHTQNLDQQVPGMEMAGPLYPVLKAMMLRGFISRFMYICIYLQEVPQSHGIHRKRHKEARKPCCLQH